MDSFSPSFPVDFPPDFKLGVAQTTLIADLTEGITKDLSFARAGAVGWHRDNTGTWVNKTANQARHHHDASGNPLGTLVELARVNYFDTPAVPANQTIDLTAIGTGDYTLFMEGTGTVTVAAGTATGTGFGAASEGTPVTFNLSVAGTVTIVVAGGPDRANVQKASDVTSFILDAAAPTVRQADSLSGTVNGSVPPNDFAVYMEATLYDINAGRSLFGVIEDVNNWVDIGLATSTKITLTKKVATVNSFATFTGAWTRGQTVKIAARVSSTQGIHIWVDGVVGSVSTAELTDLAFAGTFYIGANRTGFGQGNAAIKNLQIITDPALITDARLAERTT